MTIQEYYDNYYRTKRFPKQLPNSVKCDKTIKDFYDNCIFKNQCSKCDVLAWHDMFLEYLNLPDAIYWIRYYESGSKINGRWTNRRACYTEFKDGFSYVFVSNFDVHEIFNMIYQGVIPNAQEFLNLMKTFKYQLHYDSGKSCEESDICAYQNIGSPHGGVLTENHWYLAHINAIKSGYRRINGSVQVLSKQEVNRIFPQGIISDWKKDPVDGIMKRKLNYCLSQEEKDLVKAHFLRFVDPLNYYLIPGVYYEINSIYGNKKKSIGDYDNLNYYVSHQYELEYGNKAVMDFRDKALIDLPCNNVQNLGKEVINIKYGSVLKTKNSHKSASNSTRTKVKTSSSINKIKIVKHMTRINSRSILATLRGMQLAGKLPASLTLTSRNNFGHNLSTVPDINNGYDPYMRSIETPMFNVLLKKHGLPQDVYSCQDVGKLINVLDELVNNPKSIEASAALQYGKRSCRPAFCYLLRYLLGNMGIII